MPLARISMHCGGEESVADGREIKAGGCTARKDVVIQK